ncbi:MAG: DUF354 domain-containing protein [Blastocatellia bacterium]
MNFVGSIIWMPRAHLLRYCQAVAASYILPPMLEAISQLRQTNPTWQFILPLAPTIALAQVIALSESVPSLNLIENDTYNAVAAADLAVVASGTATLETALLGTPLIICYRASALNWKLFTPFIKVPYVGMPNLIAGREIAPELLQHNLTAAALAQQINSFLTDPVRLIQARADLADVKEKLGTAQASACAAALLMNHFMKE